jgi:hypothetical protein
MLRRGGFQPWAIQTSVCKEINQGGVDAPQKMWRASSRRVAAGRLFIDDFVWDKAAPLIGRTRRCVCGKGGDPKARDPGAAEMLFEVFEQSKRDALAAIGGHDADIRYIAEAIGVGCLCYVVILLDPAGSEANKDALRLGNQHRTTVCSPMFDPCQVGVSDLLTWQPRSMKPALVVLQFDYCLA